MREYNKWKVNWRYVLAFTLLVCCVMACFGCGAKKNEDSSSSGTVIEKVDDLPGHNIGVQLGTTGDIYAGDYENDDAGTVITRFSKGADAVQALKQDKVDCVLIDVEPAKSFVEKNPELAILEEEFALEDYAMCVSKEHPELTQQINEALDELKQDGTLANIIANYIGDDTAGKYPYSSPEGIQYDGKLVMATNVGFPPYEFYQNGVPTGIDVDMARAIADKLGKELEIKDMEFDSVIISVQSGKADIGAAGMTVTEERKKNIDFTDSYTTAKQVIIVHANGQGAKGQGLVERVKSTFIDDNRWEYIPKGLATTVIITLLSGIIGVLLGFVLSVIRVAHDRSGEVNIGINCLNVIAKIYLTIFRGTPVMVQLLIMYYVVFGNTKVSPLVAAVIAFGLNSAAYVAEAIRSGIMAIEIGQFEAGRSLGFTYGQTMIYIILPQAIKNALPAMCNEFIALLKESSIVGYVGLMDLTKAGDIIRSNTFEAMIPLISVALVYLVIVMILTTLVGRLERRLHKDAR